MSTEPVTAAPIVAEVNHKRSAERFTVVDLDWPVEADGVNYDRVTVTRMTVKQLADYMDTIDTDNGLAALPMFDVPRAVIEALDADDGQKLDEATMRFLPRAFRGKDGPDQPSGENTSPSQPPASEAKASPG